MWAHGYGMRASDRVYRMSFWKAIETANWLASLVLASDIQIQEVRSRTVSGTCEELILPTLDVGLRIGPRR